MLSVDDLAAAVSALEAAGVEFLGRPQQSDFGTTVLLLVPSGNTIELIEPRR